MQLVYVDCVQRCFPSEFNQRLFHSTTNGFSFSVCKGRSPMWAPNAQRVGHNHFGGDMSLRGNVPAIDVFRLEENDGSAWDNDLHILHAGRENKRNWPGVYRS